MIGIYKYTNKENNKIYIGRSNNITRRKWEHLHKPSPYSYFDTILQQLGENAFEFEILEECHPDILADREKYWIKYYDCCLLDGRDKGYNMTRGGEEYLGEDNPWTCLTIQQVEEIIDKLANTTISMGDLANEYHVHRNTISNINRGYTWAWLHNYTGNIREEAQGSLYRGALNKTAKITEQDALHIIDLLIHDKRSMAALARDEGYSEYIINDINRCKTWKWLHHYEKNIRKEAKLDF